jgi:hypothetical protein
VVAVVFLALVAILGLVALQLLGKEILVVLVHHLVLVKLVVVAAVALGQSAEILAALPLVLVVLV